MVDVSRFKVEVRVNDDFHDNLKAMVNRSHTLNELFEVLCETNYGGEPCNSLLEVIAETDKKIINELKACLVDDCLEFKILEKSSKNKKQNRGEQHSKFL